jgi:hypothetical protein
MWEIKGVREEEEEEEMERLEALEIRLQQHLLKAIMAVMLPQALVMMLVAEEEELLPLVQMRLGQRRVVLVVMVLLVQFLAPQLPMLAVVEVVEVRQAAQAGQAVVELVGPVLALLELTILAAAVVVEEPIMGAMVEME